jgi:hypothetical protein
VPRGAAGGVVVDPTGCIARKRPSSVDRNVAVANVAVVFVADGERRAMRRAVHAIASSDAFFGVLTASLSGRAVSAKSWPSVHGVPTRFYRRGISRTLYQLASSRD